MYKKGMAFGLSIALVAFGILATHGYAEDASKKFTRGAINTTTGWFELPFQVATQSSEDLYQGMTYGFMDGISLGVKRTLFGTWDWVTFLIPPYDKPVMDPETVFGETP